ncbi:MAG: Lycopene cyclase [Anaerolineae bacterium]|nr:Lycopene cyclase [Anaerolineae bacterium]
MPNYDYILAGGGAAGLSLAYQLTCVEGEKPSILILDLDNKRKNDRTWCFWTNAATGLEEVYYRTWKQMWFYGEGFEKKIPLGDWQYVMLRGIDFYDWMRAHFARCGGVDFVQAEVVRIEDDPLQPRVHTRDGNVYAAKWVFDSRVLPGSVQVDRKRYHLLQQHFLGWEVETEKQAFDAEALTLFDFRTPQHGVMRFMYVLPFSPQRALVEYTLFSENLLPQSEYETALKEYLASVVGVERYRVLDVEQNRIPMTDYPFPRRLGERVWAIGTLGGRVKPSSGYAFWRIWQDARQMADSLRRYGDPTHVHLSPRRYRWFDQVMLNVMYRQGHQTKRAFTALFRNNPPQRIFGFLNEANPWWEDILVLASLPLPPFLGAFLRTQILRKI